jgi:hypothetical protein
VFYGLRALLPLPSCSLLENLLVYHQAVSLVNRALPFWTTLAIRLFPGPALLLVHNHKVFGNSQRIQVSIPDNAVEDGRGFFGASLFMSSVLREDYDIQVDYSLPTWPSNNGVRVGLGTITTPFRGPITERVSGYGPREVYLTHFPDGIFHIPTSDEKGKLRMVKSGNTVTGYYFDHLSSSWNAIHAASVSSPGDLSHLNIAVWSHENIFLRQKVSVVFENIIINRGTLVCPT